MCSELPARRTGWSVDPLTAATHPDPYPYYSALAKARRALRDPCSGLWVVANATIVTEVLANEACLVRPPSEPVPQPLAGTLLGDMFGRLARWTDGPRHARVRTAIDRTLDTLSPAALVRRAEHWATHLAERLRDAPASTLQLAHRLPCYVIADWLGIPEADLPRVAGWVDELVRGLSALASAGQVTTARTAVLELDRMFRRLIHAGARSIAVLAHELDASNGDEAVANGIGLLIQSYEATAATIGQGVIALARHPDARHQLREDQGLWPEFMAEVLRHDSPVQNTRRYVARAGSIAGEEMQRGEGVLVLLAAANRDPSANPEPDRFIVRRVRRRLFGFGAASHHCPGRDHAVAIATVGLRVLLQRGLIPDSWPGPVHYRPSVNLRLPLLGPEDHPDQSA